jgi:hypothetical protein
MRVHVHTKIRLHKYGCPERDELGGIEAWQFALNQLYDRVITIQTRGWSNDRWVADIWIGPQLFGPVLVNAGHALYMPGLRIEDH